MRVELILSWLSVASESSFLTETNDFSYLDIVSLRDVFSRIKSIF